MTDVKTTTLLRKRYKALKNDLLRLQKIRSKYEYLKCQQRYYLKIMGFGLDGKNAEEELCETIIDREKEIGCILKKIHEIGGEI